MSFACFDCKHLKNPGTIMCWDIAEDGPWADRYSQKFLNSLPKHIWNNNLYNRYLEVSTLSGYAAARRGVGALTMARSMVPTITASTGRRESNIKGMSPPTKSNKFAPASSCG